MVVVTASRTARTRSARRLPLRSTLRWRRFEFDCQFRFPASLQAGGGRVEYLQQILPERGYDADYRRLRPLCFIRDEWRCVDCGWEPEIVKVYRLGGLNLPHPSGALEFLRGAFNRGERHLHADHIIPIEERLDLRLVLDNLATRCNECHARKTAVESSGWVPGRVG